MASPQANARSSGKVMATPNDDGESTPIDDEGAMEQLDEEEMRNNSAAPARKGGKKTKKDAAEKQHTRATKKDQGGKKVDDAASATKQQQAMQAAMARASIGYAKMNICNPPSSPEGVKYSHGSENARPINPSQLVKLIASVTRYGAAQWTEPINVVVRREWIEMTTVQTTPDVAKMELKVYKLRRALSSSPCKALMVAVGIDIGVDPLSGSVSNVSLSLITIINAGSEAVLPHTRCRHHS
ncbi:hypothetical protein K466DRAFT_606827 [Polyporus arcularius HHB13444]|uniref:Uncharacterized protein n=1 Tax=Polyporus arcularius HHB13444 TaxID=1314778 RepID=A0A5C3NNM1_9APHY|nr:hypothetical protein K466DRAFT_606827 [Polyporus arcularius HHB13444]